MWFIGVEVEQETSAPPPKKNPGSAPGIEFLYSTCQIKHSGKEKKVVITNGKTLWRFNSFSLVVSKIRAENMYIGIRDLKG